MELLVLLSPSALDPYKENSDLMIQSRRSTKIGTFCQFNDILCCGHCNCKQASTNFNAMCDRTNIQIAILSQATRHGGIKATKRSVTR